MKKIKIQGLAQKINRLVIVSAVAVSAIAGTAASAQIVTNGNFSQDISSYSNYAGYVYHVNDIPGFTASDTGVGVNGYGTYDPARNRVDTQFAPSGYTASATGDPVDYAFLQNSGSTLTQNLPNLNRDSVYQVSFLFGERSSDTANTGTVSIGGPDINALINPGSETVTETSSTTKVNGFVKESFTFDTGLDYTGYTLTLANSTPLTVPITYPAQPSQDRDVDFSDVVITKIGNFGAVVPEPSTYALLGLGSLGLLLAARRRTLKS